MCKLRLEISTQNELRNILFSLNKDGYANDLLYTSPNYSIVNLHYGVTFWNLVNEMIVNQENYGEPIWYLSKNFITIQDAYNLGPLLQCRGFDLELNFKNVQEVYYDF